MRNTIAACVLLLGALALYATSVPVEARGGARTSVNGGGGSRGNAQARQAGGNRSASSGANRDTSRSASRSTSRSTSREVSRDVSIEVEQDGCCFNDWDDRDHHPVAAGMAIATTAAVIGSMVSTPPPNCVPVVVGGMTYQQCGSTWYQPQMNGSGTTYVVVAPPQ